MNAPKRRWKYTVIIDLEEMFPDEEPYGNGATAVLYECTDGWLLRFPTRDEQSGDAVYTVDPEFKDGELFSVARQGRLGFLVEVVEQKRFKKQDIASVLRDIIPAPPPENGDEEEETTTPPRRTWWDELRQCLEEHHAEQKERSERSVEALFQWLKR